MKRSGLACANARPSMPAMAAPIVPRALRRFKASELRLRRAVVVARRAAHLQTSDRAVVDVTHVAFERCALPIDRNADRLQLAQHRAPDDQRPSEPVVV